MLVSPTLSKLLLSINLMCSYFPLLKWIACTFICFHFQKKEHIVPYLFSNRYKKQVLCSSPLCFVIKWKYSTQKLPQSWPACLLSSMSWVCDIGRENHIRVLNVAMRRRSMLCQFDFVYRQQIPSCGPVFGFGFWWSSLSDWIVRSLYKRMLLSILPTACLLSAPYRIHHQLCIPDFHMLCKICTLGILTCATQPGVWNYSWETFL